MKKLFCFFALNCWCPADNAWEKTPQEKTSSAILADAQKQISETQNSLQFHAYQVSNDDGTSFNLLECTFDGIEAFINIKQCESRNATFDQLIKNVFDRHAEAYEYYKPHYAIDGIATSIFIHSNGDMILTQHRTHIQLRTLTIIINDFSPKIKNTLQYIHSIYSLGDTNSYTASTGHSLSELYECIKSLPKLSQDEYLKRIPIQHLESTDGTAAAAEINNI